METKQENVIATDYADVMQKSYIDYAMSVIISQGTSGCEGRSEAGAAKNAL